MHNGFDAEVRIFVSQLREFEAACDEENEKSLIILKSEHRWSEGGTDHIEPGSRRISPDSAKLLQLTT